MFPLKVANCRVRLFGYSAEVSRGDPKATAEYNFSAQTRVRPPDKLMKRPFTWSLLVLCGAFVAGGRARDRTRRFGFRNSEPSKNAKAS